MEIKRITSAQNSFIKDMQAATRSKGPYAQLLRLEGRELLDELWLAKREAEVLVLSDRAYSDSVSAEDLQRSRSVVVVPDSLFARLSATSSPTGILALAGYPWDEKPTQAQLQTQRALWLDRVQDPGNVGTLIRSAAAFGLDAVYLGPGTASPLNEKVIRATMGALLRIPVYRLTTDALLEPSATQPTLLVTALHGENVASFRWPEQWTLVIGNEGQGVSPELIERATHKLTIPMPGETESLNAAIAGSIFLYLSSQG